MAEQIKVTDIFTKHGFDKLTKDSSVDDVGDALSLVKAEVAEKDAMTRAKYREHARKSLKVLGFDDDFIEDVISFHNDDQCKRKVPSQADMLVYLADQENLELFHTSTGDTYAYHPTNKRIDTLRIRSAEMREYLSCLFFEATKKAPSSESLQTA